MRCRCPWTIVIPVDPPSPKRPVVGVFHYAGELHAGSLQHRIRGIFLRQGVGKDGRDLFMLECVADQTACRFGSESAIPVSNSDLIPDPPPAGSVRRALVPAI